VLICLSARISFVVIDRCLSLTLCICAPVGLTTCMHTDSLQVACRLVIWFWAALRSCSNCKLNTHQQAIRLGTHAGTPLIPFRRHSPPSTRITAHGSRLTAHAECWKTTLLDWRRLHANDSISFCRACKWALLQAHFMTEWFLSVYHINTSAWYLSTGALFILFLKSNVTQTEQKNYVIRNIIVVNYNFLVLKYNLRNFNLLVTIYNHGL